MNISIGLHKVEPFVTSGVVEVFGESCEITDLQDSAEIETFIAADQFPDIKILIIPVQNLTVSADFWPNLKLLSDKVQTFHLILLKASDMILPESLPLAVGSERVHLVETDLDGAAEDLLHHLNGIKTLAEALVLKYKIYDLLLYQDELIRDHGRRANFQELIDKLRQGIDAQGIQIYFLQSLASGFVCQLGSKAEGALSVPRTLSANVHEQFTFKDSCSIYPLTQKQLASMIGAGTGSPEDQLPLMAVLSTFLLDTVPCFLLFTFDETSNERLTPEVCYVSSWMLFHLLYTQETLSRYRTLKALTDIQNVNLEKRDVQRHILDHLQTHFEADGVTLIDYKGLSHNKHTFEKTFKHYLNYNHLPFATNEGFAFHCVVNNKALLIKETFYEKSDFGIHDTDEPASRQPHSVPGSGNKISLRGDGIDFDPHTLTIESGQSVNIPLFRADRTVEDEVSLMYYPLESDDKVIGAIKIGDFTKTNTFGLLQLRALSEFADAIVILLNNVQTLYELKQSYEQRPEVMKNMAQLLSYRNLIRDIFHQVGQYLNDIGADLLTAQTFAGDRPSEELITSLKNIRQYAKFALDLITKARSRGEDLHAVPKDCALIAEVVRPAIEYAKKKAEPYKIRITTTLTNKDYPVWLDPDFAQESLKNILNNAIWAVREHKVAGKREIHIAVRESEDSKTVYMEVTDSGIGIHPEILPRVGTLFFTTRKGGSGVGLFSAKQHAEHFNGSVAIRSTFPGKGTTVRITFPLREGRS